MSFAPGTIGLNRSLAPTLHRCRLRDRVKGGERIGSCKQQSTSVSMAVAQIFTSKTENGGKGESRTQREGVQE